LGRISSATKERIRERIDMVRLVSEYVQLQPRGRDDFWGRCPFHDEKSASFHILPSRGIFKCFGCGKGGDVFRFVEELEGVSFPEALRRLAAQAGVEIEDATPRERAEQERQGVLLRASTLARDFFQEVLWSDSPDGKRGQAYLEKRAILPETAREFGLGMAPDAWDALAGFARERSIPIQALVELGLVRERDGRRYDFFRGRLMFPICDEQGKVRAFGGRALPNLDGSPTRDEADRKYMNSPEVPGFYEKRKLLFGLDHAKRARPSRLVVVEGYMDVVGPHQAGRNEFVAALGTAFTPEQARLARRYVDEVVLLFDGDAAGAQASLRALGKLVGEEGMTLRVATLPPGMDPDDAARGGTEELDRALEGADDVITFLISAALQGWDATSPAGRERAVKAAIKLLARIPDQIRLSTELGAVSDRFGIPESDLRAALGEARVEVRREAERARSEGAAGDRASGHHGGHRPGGGRPDGPPLGSGSPRGPGGRPHGAPSSLVGLDEQLLEALLAVPEAAGEAAARGLTPSLFADGPARVVAAEIFACAAEDGIAEAAQVLARVEDPASRDLLAELIGRIREDKDYRGELAGLDRLVARGREDRRKQIMVEIRHLRDPEARRQLLAEYRELREVGGSNRQGADPLVGVP
jgi:DNA primase